MKYLALILSLVLLSIAAYGAYTIYQQNAAIERNLTLMSPNIRHYKCALVKEYGDGHTTVHYNLHKKGC